MEKPISQLPTQNIANLLDRHGIEHTWKSLLYTHAAVTHSQKLDTNFTIFAEDVLKDLSIGNISVLYEFSLAHVNVQGRKKEGQFFTPDDVALKMVDFTSQFPPGGIWLDPCSGVGNLAFHLVQKHNNPADFMMNYLYLVDKDPLALWIARFLLALNFGKDFNETFNHLESRCITGDFLEITLPNFDYSLFNPPYVSTPPDLRFTTAESRDLYAYFIEKITHHAQGFISITPQSFMHVKRFQSLRQFLIRQLDEVHLYTFDNMPDCIFSGVKFGTTNTNKKNSIRPTILVGKKKSDENIWTTTPLLRWRKKDRETMLETLNAQETPFTPHDQYFPKVGSSLIQLYEQVVKYKKTIGDLITPDGDDCLYLPTTTRYYISATKRELDRGSIRTIRFSTREDQNLAYLLLNSGYFYWWWRVTDGSMNVSFDSIKSLPIPPTELNQDLIKALEGSENTNIVTKNNAQKLHESVKHDESLLYDLNAHLFGEIVAGKLAEVRLNSHVV